MEFLFKNARYVKLVFRDDLKKGSAKNGWPLYILWPRKWLEFFKYWLCVLYWRAERAKKFYYKKVKTKFGPPSPTHQTSTLDPTSDKSQGVSRPCPSYLCLRKKLVLNSIGTKKKYVEECCKEQSTVKPFQQLRSNLVYSLKISMVLKTYYLKTWPGDILIHFDPAYKY